MAAPGDPILTARDLWVSYGSEPVLRGIDLTLVEGGAPVGVIGPSGAGKTTLVHTLLGTVTPSRGSVTFRGHATHRLGRRDKKVFHGAVRHVSQYGVPTHDPRLTAQRYLDGALKDARRAGRTHPTTVDGLLTFVALDPAYASRSVVTMSGGERQRLALAHALATRPDLILLDEPLTAIDPGLRAEVLRRLAGLTADLGIAVLLVSHDLESIERLCSEVHVLADGELVASGRLRDVLATASHPAVVDLAEAAPLTAQRLR
ncbi:MAG TPA: ABC transporter [Micrococcales bacterium]|uniref:ABC transporter ATP-binding protein n=1 Tax=Miniimonas TaxID=947525 RepID=UPI000D527B21|nr:MULTISPECIES: ABC transporter ATP-binding protein [Miniimonas]HCX83692.1 ABC transporter [Micrococcales bacterium]